MEHQHISTGPPDLHEWEPAWPASADDRIRQLRSVTAGLEGADSFRWDHIGSTAVAGLLAKPIVDLQCAVPKLPPVDALNERLRGVSFVPALGARPDSPGVTHDGGPGTPVAEFPKRLFISCDAGIACILHVRLLSSPFTHDTVRFRQLLSADADLRRRYQELKLTLAAQHRDDPDYDDYTRGKSAFIRDALNGGS